MEKAGLLEDGRSSLDSDLECKPSPFDGQDNSHAPGKVTERETKTKTKTSIAKLFLAVLLGIAITQFTHVVVHYIKKNAAAHALWADMGTLNLPSSQTMTCGDSPATAAAAGCHFDPISFSWLPPQCYDAPNTAEFLSWNWTFYDSEGDATPGTAPEHVPHAVSYDVAVSGHLPELMVTEEYHLVHCIFTWRKMHRALNTDSKGWAPESVGAFMDSYTRKWKHSHHCTDTLLTFVKNVRDYQREARKRRAKELYGRRSQEDLDVALNLDLVRVVVSEKYPSCPLEIDTVNSHETPKVE